MTRCLIEVRRGHRRGRGRWWRPEARGYADSILEAGIFDEPEARRRVATSHRSVVVPLTDAEADALEGMRAARGAVAQFGLLPDPLVGELLARSGGLARLFDLPVSP